MAQLAVVALLGMLALAAAVDVDLQTKKHHEKYEHEEHHEHHNYVEVKHREYKWDEVYIKTHPCAPEYEILGSTVAASSYLKDDGKEVGKVYWTGIVAWHDIDHDSKNYKAADFHNVKINYEVIFEIEGKGQIITKGVSTSVYSYDSDVLAVLGGTGHFVGASGTISWSGNDKSGKYSASLWLPKVHDKDHDDDKDHDKY